MPQKDTSEIRENIINAIKKRGPSLPAHIAKEIDMSMLFSSAFLSELLSEKKIKITNMKVGNSPIYYLPGQEKQLEPYSEYLKNKEKEAFLLLQEKKFLKDNEQEPAIRVALRSIKDFAKYFISKEDNQGYWRYFLSPEDEFYNKKEENKEEKKEDTPKKENSPEENEIENQGKTKENENSEEGEKTEEKKESPIEKQETQNKEEKTSPKHNIFEKETTKEENTENKDSEKTKNSPKKKKEKPEFVKEVLEYLDKKEIKINKEISFKKKEYQATIQIKSDVGPIDFFLLAKGKKKISTDDVIDVINEAKNHGLYGILLYSDEIQNKAEEFAKDNSSVLKIKKIE